MFHVNNAEYQKDLEHISKYLNKIKDIDRMIHVLVIGATGLIGSHLVDALYYYNRHYEKKFCIYAMSRSRERLERRFEYAQEGIIYLQHDILQPMDLEIKFDYIFHLASNADPGSYEKWPTETIEINVLGAVHVIEYLKKYKNAKSVFASTMEVYGENDGHALREDDYGRLDFNTIRSGYPESKRTAELLYRSAGKQYDIQAVIARLGYIYGSTMTDSDNKVVAYLIKNALKKETLVLNSPGQQRRTYCYVSDAVTGLITAVMQEKEDAVFNIADSHSLISIRALAEYIAKITGSELQIKKDCGMGNPVNKDAVLDSTKCNRCGWKAETGIYEGIQKTLNILGEKR